MNRFFFYVKKWWYEKLSHRVVLSVVWICVVLLSAQGAFTVIMGRRIVDHFIESRNYELAKNISLNVTDFFNDLLDILESQARQIVLQHSQESQSEMLVTFREQYAYTFGNLYLLDGTGRVRVKLGGTLYDVMKKGVEVYEPPVEMELDESVNRAVASGLITVSGSRFYNYTGTPYIIMTVPVGISAITGNAAFFVVNVDLRTLWTRLGKYLLKDGSLYVLDSEGKIVAGSNRRELGNTWPIEGIDFRQPGTHSYKEGRQKHTVSIYPSGQYLQLYVAVDQRLGPSLGLSRWIIAGSLFFTLLSILVVVFLLRGLLKRALYPIELLTKEAYKAAESGKPENEIVLSSGRTFPEYSDIEVLISAFNGMVRGVNEARKKLERMNRELEVRVKLRTRDLEAANRELENFSYIVSHDLKAPVRGIGQLASWIKNDYQGKLDEEGARMLDLLQSRVLRMNRLIDGILQYSRIGRMKEPEEDIDLNVTVSEVIDILAPPESFRIEVMPGLPTVVGEPTRMTQLFQNLIGNAIKHMDKEQGRIIIKCEDEGGRFRFSVEDNGPGVAEKYHEKIFQIFQTLDRRKGEENTGIGLSLVKRIVELQGGSIWVESEVGKGSVFFFTIPKRGKER
ncbi:MAG: GHKL domain-containing protein [Spirochaetes bacterium]|nr:GHKL domain-containing protein [Spirochaetota bacterium]